ncbi:MAG: S8 family serine peptidase, partial [bacterium]|nr:S8 family serine peptidase [bacterium]
IPGQYIVVFKDSVQDVDAAADDIEKKHGGSRIAAYHHALKGFAANLSSDEAEKVKTDPRVAFVAEDRAVSILSKPESFRSVTSQAQVIPTGVLRVGAASSTAKGLGITVAVIDTGIDTSHPDLAGNILNTGVSCIRRTTSKDDNGHGTHVAGIIAAIDNGIGVRGVAPKAKLIPVKVLDRNGSGTWSSVICGIDWVTANASRYGIKVANMSLGGSGSSDGNCGNTNNDPFHKAICRSRDAGVAYVVAAGNSAVDAAKFVPAAYDDSVITISALADSNGLSGGGGPATNYGADDTFATFSNFGSAVDLGAPGVNIFSTWKGGSYATLSGTSMASPHVAGAVALYLNDNPGSTWTQIRNGLQAAGEALGFGHIDPSSLHPEPVLRVSSL